MGQLWGNKAVRAIKPVRHHGSIRIRFTHQGKRYGFCTGGRWSDRLDMAFAQAVCARIELDIKVGIFDSTLARYREGTFSTGTGRPRRDRKLLPLWDEWVESLGLSDETKADHYQMIRRMIERSKPSLSDTAWFTGSELAASTYNKRLGYLRRCFKWLMAQGKATVNPYESLKTKPVTTEPIAPFTKEEIGRLIAGFKELHSSYVPFVCFLLATGCRTSEAIGLQWKRIDFDRGEVTIADSTPRVRGGKGTQRKSTKTNRVTVLNMNDVLRQVLESLPMGAPDDLVFKSPKDGPIDRSNFRTAWKEVLTAQGIKYRKPYTSRHTTASHAIDQGLSLPDVAYILGHRDTRMVAQTYGHLIDRPELPEILGSN